MNTRLYLSYACSLITALSLAFPSAGLGQETSGKESGPMLRIICVASLKEDQEVTLASRDDKGEWRKYGNITLRTPFSTDWLPAATGELHLLLDGSHEPVSISCFTYPSDTKRALVILLPDREKSRYHADAINPGNLKFAKGSTLLVNYSYTTGTVALGNRRDTVKPGERLVVTPKAEANGMFRMLIAYNGKSNEMRPCYDRCVPYSEETRDLLLLFPDPVLGLRAFSLPEFGPYE